MYYHKESPVDLMEHLVGKRLKAHEMKELKDKAKVGAEHTLTFFFFNVCQRQMRSRYSI